MSRVSVNKDLLDDLADSISNKFDEDTPLTLAGMKGIVDDIPSRSSTDLSSSGATVTAPAGYYANNATKTIATGSVTAPSSISATANKSVVSNKLVLSQSVEVTPNVTTPGYISTGTSGRSTITLTSDDIAIKSATNYTPSTSSQKIIPGGTYVTGDQTIMAMPSGTAGTPTATKGTVSNHQVTITPSVTNTTGYITGSTINGTAVTVTAAELASGNKTITQNGTDIDVVGYSTVTVNVPSTIGGITQDENGYLVLSPDGGGGGGGDFFVITCEEEALNKTWQEIHDALQTYVANKVVIFMGADATNKYAAVVGTTSDPEEGEYFVTTEYGAYVFFATSASGYPVWD